MVGSTLSQVDEMGMTNPFHFANLQLTSVEKKYIMSERKGFVIIFFLKFFCH